MLTSSVTGQVLRKKGEYSRNVSPAYTPTRTMKVPPDKYELEIMFLNSIES
jgi:hypothetical protein